MNPSIPEGDRGPTPSLLNRTSDNWLVATWLGGGVMAHKSEVLSTVQVKTTELLGQAAPSPELDVNC